MDAAITLLDTHGERGLTFPLLTGHLRTGNGAIYWHVANKDELIALSADRILADAVAVGDDDTEHASSAAAEQIRALAIRVYDTLDRHPWAATHVTGTPAPPTALRIMEQIGQLTAVSRLSDEGHFVIATAIFNYVIGVAAQMVSMSATVGRHTSRSDFLAQSAARWQRLNPAEYPFLSRMLHVLRSHDDREQYIAGLDLLLNGLPTRLED